jgi:hypothetical protein
MEENYSAITRLEEEHVTPVQLQGFSAELSHDEMFGMAGPTAFLMFMSAVTAISTLIRMGSNQGS